MTTIIPTRTDMRILGAQVNIADLRNGAVATVATVAPRGTIPEAFRWPLVTGMDHTNAMLALDALAKVEIGIMTQALHPEARKMGIVLAVARCVTIATWRVTQAEIAAAESRAAIVTLTAGTATGSWTEADNAGNPDIAAAHAVGALTAEELEVVPYLVWMAVPVLALQGLSLVETGHHYLPTTARYFESTKRQVMKAAPATVVAWVTAMGVTFDDVIFHKACHPVTIALKTAIAKNAQTGAKLAAAGCGAASIRFPAMPSDVKAAKAVLALMSRAKSPITEMGGSVDVTAVAGAIAAVAGAQDGAATTAAVNALNIALSERRQATAYCCGVVWAEMESSGIVGHSLTRSFYLRKVVDEEGPEYSLGRNLYQALRSKRLENIQAGLVVGRNLD